MEEARISLVNHLLCLTCGPGSAVDLIFLNAQAASGFHDIETSKRIETQLTCTACTDAA